ncbi:hypothetical protein TrVE_jg7950 [Triparma verrucosa]|uniref:Uncharacterized protein n=1 Tax=Triparma verrucosa TaxID=1606542 RepID=A0A9W7CB22_9STRA|nr:hypothetical protein TrVE_jg7950 [Triparma verrucosa]
MSGFTDASGLPLPPPIASLLAANASAIEEMDIKMLQTLTEEDASNLDSLNLDIPNLDNLKDDNKCIVVPGYEQQQQQDNEDGMDDMDDMKNRCIVIPSKKSDDKSDDDLDMLLNTLDVDDLGDGILKGDEEVVEMAGDVGLTVPPVNDNEQGWNGVFEDHDPEDEDRDFSVDSDSEQKDQQQPQQHPQPTHTRDSDYDPPPSIPHPALQHPLLFALSQTFLQTPHLLIGPTSTCFSASLTPTLTLLTSSSGHFHLWNTSSSLCPVVSEKPSSKPLNIKAQVASKTPSGEYEVLRSKIIEIDGLTHIIIATASGMVSSYTYTTSKLTSLKNYDLTEQDGYEVKDELAPQIYALNVLRVGDTWYLITGADDTIYVWDYFQGRLIRTHGFNPARRSMEMGGGRNPNNICYIFCCDFNSKTSKGLVGLSDGTCRVVDFHLHCEQVLSLPVEGSRVTSCGWDWEGGRCTTGFSTGHVVLWGFKERWRCEGVFMVGGNVYGSLFFPPKTSDSSGTDEDELLLISWNSNGEIKTFNTLTGSPEPVLDHIEPKGDIYDLGCVKVEGGWDFVVAGGRQEGFMGCPQERFRCDYDHGEADK